MLYTVVTIFTIDSGKSLITDAFKACVMPDTVTIFTRIGRAFTYTLMLLIKQRS